MSVSFIRDQFDSFRKIIPIVASVWFLSACNPKHPLTPYKTLAYQPPKGTYLSAELHFSRDSKRLLSIDNQGSAMEWDVQSEKLLHRVTIPGLKLPLFPHFRFSADEQQIIVAGTSAQGIEILQGVDLTTRNIAFSWEYGQTPASHEQYEIKALSSDGSLVVIASWMGCSLPTPPPVVFSVRQSKVNWELFQIPVPVDCTKLVSGGVDIDIQFLAGNKYLLVNGSSIWDVQGMRKLYDLPIESVLYQNVNPDLDASLLLLSQPHTHTLILWDIAQGKAIQTFSWQDESMLGGSIFNASLSPSGNRVAIISTVAPPADDHRLLQIFDTQTGQLLHSADYAAEKGSGAFGPYDNITSVTFLQNESLGLISHSEVSIGGLEDWKEIWNLSTDSLVATLYGSDPKEPNDDGRKIPLYASLVLSPDGSVLASVGESIDADPVDQNIFLWDALKF